MTQSCYLHRTRIPTEFRYFALHTEIRWRALQAGRICVRQHPHDAQLFFFDCVNMVVIGASLSEPHIDRTSGRFLYIMVVVRPSSARRVRPHEDQEVDRKSPTCLHLPTSLSVSSHLLYLSTVAVYLSTLVVCSMSSTNHQRASATNQQRASAPRTPESETDKRERLLQRRWERERDRCDSETAVQREERLSRRRMRD